MANKYFGKINGSEDSDTTSIKDIIPRMASTVGTAASWCSSFKGESVNQAGTDTRNVTAPDFKVNGVEISGVRPGYLPTKNSCFGSVTTPGMYYLGWCFYTPNNSSKSGVEDYIELYSQTKTEYETGSTGYSHDIVFKLTASQFRDGYVPREFLVVLVGGGGGGGGTGSYCVEKDSFENRFGAAGGGGAVAAFRVKIPDAPSVDDYPYSGHSFGECFKVFVGEGGKAGSNNTVSEGSDSTNGTAGKDGVRTMMDWKTWTFAFCYGGKGGGAGSGTGNSHGTGGAGGTIDEFEVGGKYMVNGAYVSGGKGNSYNSISNTGVATLSFTPTNGTGVGALTFVSAKNNNSSTENKSNASSSYFSGGCSYGYGKYVNSSGTGYMTGGAGGGGIGGSVWQTAGNNGAAYFYY